MTVNDLMRLFQELGAVAAREVATVPLMKVPRAWFDELVSDQHGRDVGAPKDGIKLCNFYTVVGESRVEPHDGETVLVEFAFR